MKKLLLLVAVAVAFSLPAHASCVLPGPITVQFQGAGTFTIPARQNCTITLTYVDLQMESSITEYGTLFFYNGACGVYQPIFIAHVATNSSGPLADRYVSGGNFSLTGQLGNIVCVQWAAGAPDAQTYLLGNYH